jgi:Fe-S oxidoreductase
MDLPSHLWGRGAGITEEPRIIRRSIPGVQLIEFDRYGINSKCCGAGGVARKVYPENANAIGRSTIEKKADRLIFSCPACYEQVNEECKTMTNG